MAVQFKDYYQTLGVARTATPEEIKQAFRKLARIHHPDVAKNKATGEAKFKEINEAYEVLGDPEKRKRYDELGPNWQDTGGQQAYGAGPRGGMRGRAPAGGPDFEFDGTGFSDFFESFFGSGRGGGGAGPRRRGPVAMDEDEETYSQPGNDVEADLLVTLEDAFKGSKRKVTLRRPAQDGGEDRLNTYEVKIPAGVREGQRIRLAGQGGAGFGGAAAGDLYLRVRLARHPDFTVEGADLNYDLDLAPWEAVLGVAAQRRAAGCDCADWVCRVKTRPGVISMPRCTSRCRQRFQTRRRPSGRNWRRRRPSIRANRPEDRSGGDAACATLADRLGLMVTAARPSCAGARP